MRWIVGDVQGCARELEDLLEAIAFDEHRDELWLAGDMVNRGPDSLAVLRLWRSVGGRAVLGNHELYMLRLLAGVEKRKGSDTLDELFGAPDFEELLAAVEALPALVRLEGGPGPEAWLVHAGLHPAWTDLEKAAALLNEGERDAAWLMREELTFATTVRCCTPQGERCSEKGPPEDCEPPCQPWDRYYRGESVVVHGHWAWRGHYREGKVLGLDDAVVHGGSLVAWCQDEDRIVQVPARRGR